MLDAARDCVLAVGVRRGSFSDVARRAGVSRTTLYRSFPDFATLLEALMTREFGALVERVQADARSLATARERLVEATADGSRALGTDPLFRRVVEVDPEVLLPYVTDRLGTTQRMAMEALEGYVEEGRRDGSIRAVEPPLAAYCIQLMLHGFVLAMRVTAEEQDASEVFGELRLALDAFLRPTAAR